MGILILKEAVGMRKPHYRTQEPEFVAYLDAACTKYRMILIVSEHLVSKKSFRTRDGYINHDPYCSVTRNLTRKMAIDDKMDGYINQLMNDFEEYGHGKDYVVLDPRHYGDLRGLKYIDELTIRNMTDFVTGLK